MTLIPNMLEMAEAELLGVVEHRLVDRGRFLPRDPLEERCVVAWRGVRALRDVERPEEAVEAYFDEVLRPLLRPRLDGKAEEVDAILDRISLYLELGSGSIGMRN